MNMPEGLSRVSVHIIIITAAMMQWAHPLCAQDEAALAGPSPEKALGLDTVIAFYGVYPEIHPKP